jgi:hypothetical protein
MKEKLLEKIVVYLDDRVKNYYQNEIVDYEINKPLTKRSYFSMEDILDNFPNYRKNYIKKVIGFIETKTIEDINKIGKTFYRKNNYESNFYIVKKK